MICSICARWVRLHDDEQAMRCYQRYLAYPDPEPSPAFISKPPLLRDAVYA